MGASSYPFSGITDPTAVEALACLETVRFEIELGFCDVCIEGDAQTIIKKVNMEEIDRSTIGTIIDEIRPKNRDFDT